MPISRPLGVETQKLLFPQTLEFENETYIYLLELIYYLEKIGFESSANIFSNSSSAKLGGKIGWVNESQLSKSIISNLQNLNLFSPKVFHHGLTNHML